MLGLIAVAVLPGAVKRFAYRWLYGYRIAPGTRIGLVYLDCASLSVGKATRLSHGVVFARCGEVVIGEHVQIGSLNLFRGGNRIHLEDYAQVLRLNVINAIPEPDCPVPPDSSFHLGYGSVITAEHRVDFTESVRIGRRSILGGRNSSIWTHNRRDGKRVEIGDYCYVGSEIRMAPGSAIPDCSIVGLGSVITSALSEGHCLIAGVPAKSVRPLGPDDYELLFRKTRPDLPEDGYEERQKRQEIEA
jgi:acetyltransferase-like isoleucine patch superfamily enzyme